MKLKNTSTPSKGGHQSVLLQEVIEGLDTHPGETVVDATLGLGGLSAAICKATQGKVNLIGFDADLKSLARAKKHIESCGCEVKLVHENFRNLSEGLSKLGITQVERILFDLGWSSVQLQESGRGFSFLRDEPLLMTLSDNVDAALLTARDIVNDWDVEDLTNVILAYGEERFARKIAKAICEARVHTPIETTGQLAALIEETVPIWYRLRRIHPATKTFQALRIAVNDELQALTEALPQAWQALTPGGRIAIIAFHSLEDRIVKNFFRDLSHEGRARLITKKPIVPTSAETAHNTRSRSAKLRIIEKV